MSDDRSLRASERWLRALLHLYPRDFREEMGEGLLEAYLDHCRAALRRGGRMSLGLVWLKALKDSLRNGVGERLSPGITWRRRGNWGRDAGLAVRRLVRAPVFVLSMVGTLTVGLGAFAVVYTVVQKVLIAPLPYERPDDLYFVWRDYTAYFDLDRGWLAGTDVAALDSAGGVIEGATALRRMTATLAGRAGTEPVEIAVFATTPKLLPMLGARPALGRVFARDEVGPGRPDVIVLGHDMWRERFGSDPAVVGSEIRLNGQPYTVIGVMQRDFRFARHSSLGKQDYADAYITFAIDLATTNPGAGSYSGLIRARPGTSHERVAAEVDAVGRMIDERMGSRGLKLYPVGIKPDLIAPVRPALLVLGVAGAFLVLVLTVNLATLLLARAAQREREYAISRALGADQMALIRATLLEGGLLGALGGAGGALVALWGTRALLALAPMDLPRREAIGVDWGIAATVIGLGALLGLLAGAVPAAWATRTSLASLMSNASVRGGGGHGRMRRGLVVVQVALSLVLLTAGGLVVRSFERLLSAEPGFDPGGVLTLRVPVSPQRFPERADAAALHRRVRDELAAIPGVTSVGAASALPLSAGASQTTVRFPASAANTGVEEHDRPLVDYVRVHAGLIETLGIPVIAGRSFRDDTDSASSGVLIDRTLADRFYPGGNAIGERFLLGPDSLYVIGVVEHARLYDVHRDGRGQVYLQNHGRSGTLSWALRTARAPTSLAAEARAALRRVDPELAVSDVRSMEQIVGDSVRQQRLTAVLITGFALGALLLAAMGLFGVVSSAVTRRRHELAVRLALGADQALVTRLVVGEGALLIGLGLLVGGPGIYFTGKIIAGALVGVSPYDPITIVAVAAGLGAVALLACWIPARRVARIDQARMLRTE